MKREPCPLRRWKFHLLKKGLSKNSSTEKFPALQEKELSTKAYSTALMISTSLLTLRLSELLEQEKYLTVGEKWSGKFVRERYKMSYNLHLIKESMDLKNFKVTKKKVLRITKLDAFLQKQARTLQLLILFFFFFIPYCFSLEKVQKKHWRTFIGILI